MRRLHPLSRFLFAVLLAGAYGCAGSDGGPVGTGIIAQVVGNVVAVNDQSTDLEGIEVTIDELPELRTSTDREGNFALEGEFAGALTLRFRTAGVDAAQAVDIPAGSLIVLEDVELIDGEIEAQAGRLVDFVGDVTRVDCDAGVLVVDDERPRPGSFRVELLPDTAFLRRDGTAAACTEIETGERISVDGLLAADPSGALSALRVTIGAGRRERRAVVEDVPFLGVVTAIRCEGGSLVIADASRISRIRVTSDTMIERPDGTGLGCGEIHLGNQVTGLGRLHLRRPGAIEATTVIVSRASQPGAPLRIAGFVASADCEASVLQIEGRGGVIALRLRPDTVVTPPLSCAEIPAGARIRGTGRVSEDDPGVIDAVHLEIRPVPR